MNPARLLALYERIAEAPDAVARLRRFVLDLAVRGKLVPQDPSEELSQELLKRVGRSLSASPELPPNWRRASLGALVQFQYGKGLPATQRSAEGPVPLFGSNGIVGYTTEALTSQPAVIVGRKGSAGALNLCDGPSWTTDVAYFVEAPTYIALRFLFLSLDALRLGELGKGVKPGLSRSDAYAQQINIPPIDEQHRIVAKVDELMALCDRLEAARTAREATRDRLAAASLASLNTPDPETFPADARFVLDALPALSARPDQIKHLRQTILNLAVRGKLVPQDPNDELATDLIKRIAAERDALVKRREIRNEEPVSQVAVADAPFDLPPRWVWARLGNAVLFTQYGTSEKATPSAKGVPVLTMGNIQAGKVVWGDEKRIPEDSDAFPALWLRTFDLLFNRTNSAELVGKVGIYLGADNQLTFASYLIRLRPSLKSTDPRFLNLALNTSEFRRTQIVPLIKKQTGQANVNGTALKNMLVPIPPLAEQHRIVAKVNELMALCDALEASLAAATAARTRLLQATLAEALMPAEGREMEAAE
ncbi:restriction endonuclease subunit S [Roseomonas sp. CAU 1739]|uniref:restriction endonuclease subunit S n=1 Tax=Roseomonas sp. CAU 1739 TaxID=3140364 RepID=UPI00325A8DB6